jgi:hypothetical protein
MGAAEFFNGRGQVEDVEEVAVTEKRWPSSERRGQENGTPCSDCYAG